MAVVSVIWYFSADVVHRWYDTVTVMVQFADCVGDYVENFVSSS